MNNLILTLLYIPKVGRKTVDYFINNMKDIPKSEKDIVDEIIIVDTGSSDNSKEMAKRYTDNIYDYNWNDDFSEARNFSFEKATKDYILWLDADEILENENKDKLLHLKQSLSSDIDVVTMFTCMNIDECGSS